MTAEVDLVSSTTIKKTQFTKRQNKGEKQRKSSTWSDARCGGFPNKICVQAVKLNTRTVSLQDL